jgi:uncharacterized membrane protein YfcA
MVTQRSDRVAAADRPRPPVCLGRAVTTGDVLALVGVGVVAGVVSTVVSLASIVSYPALLALGLSPLSANVTNTVALVFVGLGAVAGSRVELAGQGRLVLRLGVLTTLGGAAGAALLLLTPPRAFEYVAPWLIGGAALVLLGQPRVARRAGTERGERAEPAEPAEGRERAEPAEPATPAKPAEGGERGLVLRAALFGVAIYTGYFGAAGGILSLAVLGPMLGQPLVRTNAVKNAVSGFANGVAALAFALFGPVRWAAAGPLAVGFLLGGWLGPALVRRLPATVLRALVVVCGLAVAVKLGLDTYR